MYNNVVFPKILKFVPKQFSNNRKRKFVVEDHDQKESLFTNWQNIRFTDNPKLFEGHFAVFLLRLCKQRKEQKLNLAANLKI